jgi:hypothetical protein
MGLKMVKPVRSAVMTDLHLVNKVVVWQPRWHDRVILPKCKKFVEGNNIITIDHHNYPNMYYIHSSSLRHYPKEIKHGSTGDYEVYVIPLDDLVTVQEAMQINKDAKEVFDDSN